MYNLVKERGEIWKRSLVNLGFKIYVIHNYVKNKKQFLYKK